MVYDNIKLMTEKKNEGKKRFLSNEYEGLMDSETGRLEDEYWPTIWTTRGSPPDRCISWLDDSRRGLQKKKERWQEEVLGPMTGGGRVDHIFPSIYKNAPVFKNIDNFTKKLEKLAESLHEFYVNFCKFD